MCRGAVPLQGTGRGQEQRAGAHRGDHLGTAVGLAQIVHQHRVHQLPQGGRATAGHDHDVRLGKLLQRRRGGHPHRGVGGHRVEVFGDHHNVVTGLHAIDAFGDLQTGHDLQRSDQIQRGQTGVQHEGDDLIGHDATSGAGSAVVCSWQFMVVLLPRQRLYSAATDCSPVVPAAPAGQVLHRTDHAPQHCRTADRSLTRVPARPRRPTQPPPEERQEHWLAMAFRWRRLRWVRPPRRAPPV
jgi:hypothetical protein